MYIPKYYEVNDRANLFGFMKDNSFGILFSNTDDEPWRPICPS